MVLITLASNAQTDNPILPRIYEDGYSVAQIEEFALQSTEYSSNYRRVLLRIINHGLRESGEYINVNGGQPLTSSHISWIYDHVERDPNGYLPVGYSNTYRSGNNVASTKGKTAYHGPIDRFVFGSCVVNLDKPSCINLLGDLGIFNVSNKVVSQQQDLFQEEKRKNEASKVLANEPAPPLSMLTSEPLVPISNYAPPEQEEKNLPKWVVPTVVVLGTALLTTATIHYWPSKKEVAGSPGGVPGHGDDDVDGTPGGFNGHGKSVPTTFPSMEKGRVTIAISF